MDEFVQQVATGLSTGSVYAVVALAIVLIYRSTSVVNFAQGEMAMFSTFIAWSFLTRMDFWPAFFLALAFLSRQTTILATPFFLYWMVRQQHPTTLSREALFSRESLMQAGLCLGTLLPFVLFSLWYNDIRFGSPFETGLEQLYNRYGPVHSFYFSQFPEATRFDMFDVRNIPLHLYTIFLMPPEFFPDWSVFRPSPYGISVLLTSPAFIYAAFVKRDDPLKLGSWLAIALVSVPLLLHWTQGWVQFG